MTTKKDTTKKPATKKAPKTKATDAPADTLSVADVAREMGVDPKAARAALLWPMVRSATPSIARSGNRWATRHL